MGHGNLERDRDDRNGDGVEAVGVGFTVSVIRDRLLYSGTAGHVDRTRCQGVRPVASLSSDSQSIPLDVRDDPRRTILSFYRVPLVKFRRRDRG